MNKTRCGFWALLLVLLLVNPIEIGLAQGTFVMPSGMANQSGDASYGPFGDEATYYRYQQFYAPSDMPMPYGVVYITSIDFRLAANGRSIDAIVPDMEVRVAVAPSWIRVDGQGTSIFTENLDSNVQTVFSRGSFRLAANFVPGATTQPFSIHIPLSQPYLYDRSWGPLVLDFIQFQSSHTSVILDASPNYGEDSVSSIRGSLSTGVPASGGASYAGLVTRFGWEPVPEPSVLCLGLLGLVAFSTSTRLSNKRD